ncbi:MAG TPA: RIO1 family regulatory kinase/ATPase [Chloroflexia bacterium]|nr:RIO1 family regulatory kinase/ATPase [Chloroflexia bacterium]
MKWYTQYLDDLDEIQDDIQDDLERGPTTSSKKNGKRKPKRGKSDVLAGLAEEGTDAGDSFKPSFGSMTSSGNHLSKHEKEWIMTYLGAFYKDHLISDVMRRVKGGKEATVYVCQAGTALGTDLVAGKVYHPRAFRNLSNDMIYRQGREIMDGEGRAMRGKREQRAMANKTRFGQELRHMTWLGNEYGIMQQLHKAGVDLPQPFAQGENAILMEYIGDEVSAAPALNQVSLPKGEARQLFDRLVHNVELMLSLDHVHGDLSAYNILYWEGEVKLIDFPQAVNIYVNPHAYPLLVRDVERLCQYFAKYGITADAQDLTKTIWARCIPT